MYETLATQLFDPDSYNKYSQALQSKGQGSGTRAGKAIFDFAQYIELATSFVSVYNACEIKFYTQAFSKFFSGIPDFINQLVNIFFRNQDTALFEAIEQALADNDEDACAAALGPVVVLVFNVQVPEVSGTSEYQNTDGTQATV